MIKYICSLNQHYIAKLYCIPLKLNVHYVQSVQQSLYLV